MMRVDAVQESGPSQDQDAWRSPGGDGLIPCAHDSSQGWGGKAHSVNIYIRLLYSYSSYPSLI